MFYLCLGRAVARTQSSDAGSRDTLDFSGSLGHSDINSGPCIIYSGVDLRYLRFQGCELFAWQRFSLLDVVMEKAEALPRKELAALETQIAKVNSAIDDARSKA